MERQSKDLRDLEAYCSGDQGAPRAVAPSGGGGGGGGGRPKRMWRRTIEDEIRSTRRSWNEVKGIAGDRNAWKLFMGALCSTRSKRI